MGGIANLTEVLYKIQEFYSEARVTQSNSTGHSTGKSTANPPDFLVHDERDDAGVVVVEGVEAGRALSGWSMETDKTVEITTLEPIPLGHKVALRDIAEGNDVIKYGEVIGRASTAIPAGSHLHVHNTKTKKW